jgi:hypothetical protein
LHRESNCQATLAALVSALFLLAAAADGAQTQLPDFTGRWILVDTPAANAGGGTLNIIAADELAVTQTPLSIIIVHTSKPGTHPAEGAFRFGAGGTVGATIAGAAGHPAESRWGVSFVGSQLIISTSMTSPPDAEGVRVTVAYGAIWLLDADGRLVIEFEERRSGAEPKTATRVYVRRR